MGRIPVPSATHVKEVLGQGRDEREDVLANAVHEGDERLAHIAPDLRLRMPCQLRQRLLTATRQHRVTNDLKCPRPA